MQYFLSIKECSTLFSTLHSGLRSWKEIVNMFPKNALNCKLICNADHKWHSSPFNLYLVELFLKTYHLYSRNSRGYNDITNLFECNDLYKIIEYMFVQRGMRPHENIMAHVINLYKNHIKELCRIYYWINKKNDDILHSQRTFMDKTYGYKRRIYTMNKYATYLVDFVKMLMCYGCKLNAISVYQVIDTLDPDFLELYLKNVVIAIDPNNPSVFEYIVQYCKQTGRCINVETEHGMLHWRLHEHLWGLFEFYVPVLIICDFEERYVKMAQILFEKGYNFECKTRIIHCEKIMKVFDNFEMMQRILSWNQLRKITTISNEIINIIIDYTKNTF